MMRLEDLSVVSG